MQLDDHLKNLLRELGHAINDTVSESDRITGAIAGVRAHGYDIVLKLDATIGLAKRDGQAEDGPRITTQDRRFLESLRIQVDQESMDQDADKRAVARLTMTPQDVRFLKSLRIATDDSEGNTRSKSRVQPLCFWARWEFLGQRRKIPSSQVRSSQARWPRSLSLR